MIKSNGKIMNKKMSEADSMPKALLLLGISGGICNSKVPKISDKTFEVNEIYNSI
jgi:hypothetical protein